MGTNKINDKFVGIFLAFLPDEAGGEGEYCATVSNEKGEEIHQTALFPSQGEATEAAQKWVNEKELITRMVFSPPKGWKE